jgi:3',5'-cyclic AMP phosphodiesterase CpdA
MRTLVHLSDLHFGRIDAAVIEPLMARVAAIRPDVVVVSGDLTQRAKAKEFEAARTFLDRLPTPRIVVPGNHDVPLYRVWERFLSPLGKYRRFVTDDLAPLFVDDEIAVLGVNTARSLTFKHGRINEAQITTIRERFDPLPAALTRIVVTHHPFDLPDESGEARLVGRAGLAMAAFAACGVDLLLAGHFHTSQTGETSRRHPLPGYSALVVQAGTATSTRGRGEANAFNVLRVQGERIDVERQVWQPETGAFATGRTEAFRREASRWIESPQPDQAAGS